MRNGDFGPTRFDAQVEACEQFVRQKMDMDTKTNVGLLSMAGSRIEVLSTPADNPSKIISMLERIRIGGKSDFVAGLKIAQLVLKNRQSKNLKQRIVLFIGSPVEEDSKSLETLGKMLKKNSVAVDVVNFGTENAANGNAEKLQAFVQAVDSNNNSHLLNVPPGPHELADLVMSMMIEAPAGGAGAGAGAGGAARGGAPVAGAEAAAIEDADVQMAIRLSMEEAQRQAAARQPPATPASTSSAAAQPASSAAMEPVPMEDDEEALLAQAIALSMEAAQSGAGEEEPAAAAAAVATAPTPAPATATATGSTATPAPASVDVAQLMQDDAFVQDLLSSAGMSSEDLDVNDLLKDLTREADKPAGDKPKDKDEGKK